MKKLKYFSLRNSDEVGERLICFYLSILLNIICFLFHSFRNKLTKYQWDQLYRFRIKFSYISYRYNQHRLFFVHNYYWRVRANHEIIGKNISLLTRCRNCLCRDESQCVRLIKSYFLSRWKSSTSIVLLLLRSDYRYLIKCTSPITKLHCILTDSLRTLWRRPLLNVISCFITFWLDKLSIKSNYTLCSIFFNSIIEKPYQI